MKTKTVPLWKTNPEQKQIVQRARFFFRAGSHVLFEAWYDLLQKLSGRSVNPGLQMFGQSISGNVDMDGNGYAGTSTAVQVKSCTKFSQPRRENWDENTIWEKMRLLNISFCILVFFFFFLGLSILLQQQCKDSW